MAIKESILVYYDGGDVCLHDVDKTKSAIKKEAGKNGQIGYLSGYRYWNNEKQSVMVFFTEKPTIDEIERRKRNGFLRARWHWL